jgi:hypothetical protein
LENENQRPITLDEITLSFQRESEALRELVRNRDMQLKALKAHCLCLRTNFKSILEAVVDRVIDDDVQFHARKMIETLDRDDVEKVGAGQ